MTVNDVLDEAKQALVTIDADRPLIEAASKLSDGTDILVAVGPDGTMVGVVTKTDVVRQMSVCEGASCRRAISSVMSRDILTCTISHDLRDLADRMRHDRRKNVPVVDPYNQPIGMVPIRSILRVLLRDVDYEEAQLVDYVKGVGYR